MHDLRESRMQRMTACDMHSYLKVGDRINCRRDNGKFEQCTIYFKNENVLTMKLDNGYNTINLRTDYHRLAMNGLQLRQRPQNLSKDDLVWINPTLSNHKGWHIGKIIETNGEFGQDRIGYCHNNIIYKYWVQCDDENEIVGCFLTL